MITLLLSLSALDVVTLYPSFSLELLFYIYIDSTYTVEEAVEKLGFGSFQLLVTVFSGLLWVSREGPSVICNYWSEPIVSPTYL